MPFLGRVIPEQFPTMAAWMCSDNMVHLLMVSSLHSLIKSLPTNTTSFQLQFDIMSIKMHHVV